MLLKYLNRGEYSPLRHQTFSEIKEFLSRENLESAQHCVAKLQNVFPEKSHLRRNKVLVAYGGGKDSSYMLAFVRTMQLILFMERGETFQMRVVTNRHAGMPKAVIENIHRVYNTLQLYQDPDVELLLADGQEVSLFDPHRPLPRSLRDQNRQDILMSGHKTQANPRPTFCNACNISMVNSFAVAISYGDGVDVIITGDSPMEQRAYMVWVNRLARQVSIETRSQGRGFKAFLKTMSALSQRYFQEIYGENAATEVQLRTIISDELTREILFFSIYESTCYSAGDHWELLTKYLGFEFDELAFSFSESDCANPALMAHLRGLKCERVYNRSYVEGIQEYVNFALGLMCKKQFPAFLINKMSQRYSTKEAIELMRKKVNAFAFESFGITEEQLICMVYAPFTQSSKNLEMYLLMEQPQLLPHIKDIRRLLNSTTDSKVSQLARQLACELHRLSGLNLQQLKVCYASQLLGQSSSDNNNIVDLVLQQDPHKSTILTRKSFDGPIVQEVISGR